MSAHDWATTPDGDRVECRWCMVSPLSDHAQDPCPDVVLRDASDRMRASESAKAHVVREDDVELDKMADEYGRDESWAETILRTGKWSNPQNQ